MRVKAVKVNKPTEIEITTDFIKMDQFLKFSGECMTGGEAKQLIEDGLALVNGEKCTERGKKLFDGDKVRVEKKLYQIVKKNDVQGK